MNDLHTVTSWEAYRLRPRPPNDRAKILSIATIGSANPKGITNHEVIAPAQGARQAGHSS
jgi:hypothetical protein